MKTIFRAMTAVCVLLLVLIAAANDGGLVPLRTLVLWAALTTGALFGSAWLGGLFDKEVE